MTRPGTYPPDPPDPALDAVDPATWNNWADDEADALFTEVRDVMFAVAPECDCGCGDTVDIAPMVDRVRAVIQPKLDALREEIQALQVADGYQVGWEHGVQTATRHQQQRVGAVAGAVSGPERIQRKRSRGWRMPPNTVYVGRPSRWGNVFMPWNAPAHRKDDVQAWLVEAFREWCSIPSAQPFRDAVRAELAGRNLACWCPPDQPCHADVLLDLADPRTGGGS